jgi:hypothetical protein
VACYGTVVTCDTRGSTLRPVPASEPHPSYNRTQITSQRHGSFPEVAEKVAILSKDVPSILVVNQQIDCRCTP